MQEKYSRRRALKFSAKVFLAVPSQHCVCPLGARGKIPRPTRAARLTISLLKT